MKEYCAKCDAFIITEDEAREMRVSSKNRDESTGAAEMKSATLASPSTSAVTTTSAVEAVPAPSSTVGRTVIRDAPKNWADMTGILYI